MTVAFANNRRDLYAFALHHNLRLPVNWGSCLIIGLLLANSVTLGLPEDTPWLARGAIFLAVFIGWSLAFSAIVLVTTLISISPRQNPAFITTQTVTCTEPLLIVQNEFARTEYQWRAVQRLVRTEARLFVYVQQHGALVIPRRAFADPAEWEAFYRFCRRKLTENTAATRP